MTTAKKTKYLVRLGSDITIKSDRIRAKFVARLDANLRAGLRRAGVQATIKREWSRLFIESADPRTGDVLRRTFGISSFSPIDREVASDMETMQAAVAEQYGDMVAGKTFAIRPKRVGTHSYSSVDVGRQLGAALHDRAAGVDLSKPQVEIHCDIREGLAFLYSRCIPGPCGLPLGVSGRVLCLMSGGFDSAVSAWMMMKRGLEVDYLFCNLAGAAYERSVLSLAKFLADEWAHGSRPAFHVLDFEPLAAAIRQRVRPSHAQIQLKRCFYRAGEAIAVASHRDALVTGECIGQVSSQTLRNLCTIERVIDMPVLRPVIGLDKQDIIDQARKIGSFDMSASIQEYCQLVPDKPVTACSPDAAEREEQALAGAEILAAALAGRRTQMLDAVDVTTLATDYLFVEKIPESACIIDVRPVEAFELWHPDGARSIELHDLMTSSATLAKDGVYVLVCPVGLQSAVGAEFLQKKGYRAYSLRGGLAQFSATTP